MRKTNWFLVAVSSIFGCIMASAFSQYSMTVSALSLSSGIASQVLLTGDTVKSAVIIIAMLVSGILVEKLGAKTTCKLALVCFLIPQGLMPYVNNVSSLMLLKVVQGMSTIIFPIFITTIIHHAKESDVGLATAIFNGVFYSGAGIGAYISGMVIARWGWECSYWVIGIMVFITGVIWLSSVKLPEKSQKNVATQTNGLKGYGKMLADKQAWLLVGIFLVYTWVLQAIAVSIPIYSEYLGYEVQNIGKIMTATSIGIILSSLVSGKLSDYFADRAKNRFNARVYTIAFGALLILISVGLLITVDVTKMSVYYIICFLFAVGGAWGLGVFWSIVPEVFCAEKLSLATGFIGGMGDLSMPIAPFVTGVVFGMRGLWHLGWIASAFMALVSFLCCVRVVQLNRLESKAVKK